MSGTNDAVTEFRYKWMVQRPDGVGFVTSSETGGDSEIHGASNGLRLLELRQNEQIFGSRLMIEGTLQSDALSSDDMRAHRWDFASLNLAIEEPEGEAEISLCEGEFEQVFARGSSFESSVRIVPRRLAIAPCVATAPECRASLGDKQCGVAMRDRRQRLAIQTSDGVRLSVDGPVDDRYRLGHIRWTSGPNTGLYQGVVSVESGEIILAEPPPFPPQKDDRLEISQGCDGRAETCGDRFDNIANFRGEPCLPHTDKLMRYPGA